MRKLVLIASLITVASVSFIWLCRQYFAGEKHLFVIASLIVFTTLTFIANVLAIYLGKVRAWAISQTAVTFSAAWILSDIVPEIYFLIFITVIAILMRTVVYALEEKTRIINVLTLVIGQCLVNIPLFSWLYKL